MSGRIMVIDPAEHETKFIIPAARLPVILRHLQSVCDPDPEFPSGVVSTIYYDTVELDLLRQKLDSDYLKSKVRLRWYCDLDGASQSDESFLEVKQRIGTLRNKLHLPAKFSPAWLSKCSLDDPQLNGIIPQILAAGEFLQQHIFPILCLEYERHRFIERSGNTRVCLDQDIRVTKVNPSYLKHTNPLALGLGVFELKGEVLQLPATLLPVVDLGGRKGSFSKYLACFQHSC